MSEKIIDTAEQTAEAAPKAAKKKPAALKKPADSGSFCVYLGPTMMGWRLWSVWKSSPPGGCG